MNVLTATGTIKLRRRYFWSRSAGGTCPSDASIGIRDQTVTSGARCLLCTLGVIHDFKQAAADLHRVAGIRVSAERLRQIVESEGRLIKESRLSGRFEPGWSASRAELVYVGVDGVMVRSITEVEKKKRRKQHESRRRKRRTAGIGNTKRLPRSKRGTTDTFKEMKIGIFYTPDKTDVLTFATAKDHAEFGRRLEKHAHHLALDRCCSVVSLTDGAPWIRNRILDHLPYVRAMLLDFYHLSEHIWDAAKCCLGDTDAAGTWARAQLHELKHVGAAGVLDALAALGKKVRASHKKKRLRVLRDYITDRWEMVEYPNALSQGWDIGSGPTEAMCKNLTLRLKRTGMKWDPANAEALMTLVALRESGQWDRWWQSAAA